MSNRNNNAANVGNWIRRDKRLAIYLRDGQCCAWCGASVEDEGVELTLDHLVPCELGGDNSETNLVTACRSCNCARGALTVRQWLAWLRDHDVDTEGMARRVRVLRTRSLRKYRRIAKKIIKSRA